MGTINIQLISCLPSDHRITVQMGVPSSPVKHLKTLKGEEDKQASNKLHDIPKHLQFTQTFPLPSDSDPIQILVVWPKAWKFAEWNFNPCDHKLFVKDSSSRTFLHYLTQEGIRCGPKEGTPKGCGHDDVELIRQDEVKEIKIIGWKKLKKMDEIHSVSGKLERVECEVME